MVKSVQQGFSGLGTSSCAPWLTPLGRRGRRDRVVVLTSTPLVAERFPVHARVSSLTVGGDRRRAWAIWQDCRDLLVRRSTLVMAEWREAHGTDLLREAGRLMSRADPKVLVQLALETLTPSVEMVSIKKAGAVYQVPRPLKASRGRMVALRFRKDAVRAQTFGSGRSTYKVGHALANEVLLVREDRLARSATGDVPSGVKSASLAKKLAVYRTAVANRNFLSMVQDDGADV